METATNTLGSPQNSDTKPLSFIPFPQPAVSQYDYHLLNGNGNISEIVYITENIKCENPDTSTNSIEEISNETENVDDGESKYNPNHYDDESKMILLRMLADKVDEMTVNINNRKLEARNVEIESSEDSDSDSEVPTVLYNNDIGITVPTKKQIAIIETRVSNSEENQNFDYAEYVSDLIKQQKKVARKKKKKLREKEDYDDECFEVELSWEVAPLHRIETNIGCGFTSAQKKQMLELGVPIRWGKFSVAEDEIIEDNFKMFCKDYNIPQDGTPFLHLSDSPLKTLKDKLNFARYLARGLDDRPLIKVYSRFLRIVKNQIFKNGKFTSHEDNIILEYVKQRKSEKPFSELSKILQRSSASVQKRYKKLSIATQKRKIIWTDEKCIKFVKRLMEATQCSDLNELKDREISTTEFSKLSRQYRWDIGSLRRVWNCTIYPRLYIKQDCMPTHLIKEQMIDILIKRNDEDVKRINWKEVAREIDGFTGIGLNKMYLKMVSLDVPINLQNNLKETLMYLKKVLTSRGMPRNPFVIKKLHVT